MRDHEPCDASRTHPGKGQFVIDHLADEKIGAARQVDQLVTRTGITRIDDRAICRIETVRQRNCGPRAGAAFRNGEMRILRDSHLERIERDRIAVAEFNRRNVRVPALPREPPARTQRGTGSREQPVH
jgi:hypothetical protein